MQQSPKIELIMAPCRRLQFNLSDMYPVPRLGLADLAGYLQRHGFEKITIRDIIAHREWLQDILARYQVDGAPDILGIGTTILSLREAFAIASAVKGVYPDVVVVLGGPGVGFAAEALLAYGRQVDYFVRGEGEEALLGIAKMVCGEEKPEQIPRLIWRSPTGEAIENPPGEFRDLNDGAGTLFSLLPMAKYQLHPPMGVYPPATMLETSRGCTYACDFCCLSRPVRYKDPAVLEKQICEIAQAYGIQEFHFVDPTFTLNRLRTLEICRRLKPLNLRWSCKTRVDLMPQDVIKAMADSGCYLVAFGVESGNDEILGNLKKTTASSQAIEVFAACRAHRIRTAAYLMIGNPGDTGATLKKNVSFVRKLDPDYVLYDILQADPGNPLTHEAIRNGLFSSDDLERYYLTDELTRLHEITVSGHSVDQVQAWIRLASKDFYLRPTYFWKRIRDIRTLQDAANLGSGGSTFFKDMLGIGKLWKWSGR